MPEQEGQTKAAIDSFTQTIALDPTNDAFNAQLVANRCASASARAARSAEPHPRGGVAAPRAT